MKLGLICYCSISLPVLKTTLGKQKAWLQRQPSIDFSAKFKISGLPWWYSRLESACQYREHGFDSWSGKIPHAMGQISPEPQLLKPEGPSASTREAKAMRSLCTTTREQSLLVATREKSEQQQRLPTDKKKISKSVIKRHTEYQTSFLLCFISQPFPLSGQYLSCSMHKR